MGCGDDHTWAFPKKLPDYALVRKEWQWSLAVLLGAIATFLALLFARPPLWAGGLLDLALVAALAWTYRPRPGIARA